MRMKLLEAEISLKKLVGEAYLLVLEILKLYTSTRSASAFPVIVSRSPRSSPRIINCSTRLCCRPYNPISAERYSYQSSNNWSSVMFISWSGSKNFSQDDRNINAVVIDKMMTEYFILKYHISF